MASDRVELNKRFVSNFRYRNGDVEILHTTCVPTTGEEAVAYAERVASWYGEEVEYIEHRSPGSLRWKQVFWDVYDEATQTWERFQPRLTRTMG